MCVCDDDESVCASVRVCMRVCVLTFSSPRKIITTSAAERVTRSESDLMFRLILEEVIARNLLSLRLSAVSISRLFFLPDKFVYFDE